MTKHKRTQEDWIEIGTSLKKIYNELLDEVVITGQRVGVTNTGFKKIDRALSLINEAMCDLEGQMFRENPNLSNYWLNLFYGPETDFDPDSEEAKRYESDPLHLKKTTKEEQ